MNNTFDKEPSLAKLFSNPVYIMDPNNPPDKMAEGIAAIKLLRLDHLKSEEKNNIIPLVIKHLDRF